MTIKTIFYKKILFFIFIFFIKKIGLFANIYFDFGLSYDVFVSGEKRKFVNQNDTILNSKIGNALFVTGAIDLYSNFFWGNDFVGFFASASFSFPIHNSITYKKKIYKVDKEKIKFVLNYKLDIGPSFKVFENKKIEMFLSPLFGVMTRFVPYKEVENDYFLNSIYLNISLYFYVYFNLIKGVYFLLGTNMTYSFLNLDKKLSDKFYAGFSESLRLGFRFSVN